MCRPSASLAQERKGRQQVIGRGRGRCRDARPGRVDWLAANPSKPAESKKGNKMKDPKKLAASRKAPKVPYYLEGSSRVVYARE